MHFAEEQIDSFLHRYIKIYQHHFVDVDTGEERIVDDKKKKKKAIMMLCISRTHDMITE